MSAWHLPTLHLSIVRDGLVYHEICTKEAADKLLKAFAKMNAYAIKARYGENVRAKPIHAEVRFKIKLEALHNMLHCIRYQCLEGDTDTKHKTTWNKLEWCIGKVADAYLSNQHAPGKLPWGIFDMRELKEERNTPFIGLLEKEATA